MIFKKLTKSMMLLLTLLIVCGCTINDNHYGMDMQTFNITAYKNTWYTTDVRQGNKGHYMFQEFSFPEINNAVLDEGAVLVYYIDNAGRDNILPLVLPYEDNRASSISENVRYEVERGILTIIIESSDFSSASRNSDMEFKVCILRNNL